jgi:hypothetical protein
MELYSEIFPGVKLTTHLQLVLRLRKGGSIHPIPHTPSWRSAKLVKHRDNFTFYSEIALSRKPFGTGQMYIYIFA